MLVGREIVLPLAILLIGIKWPITGVAVKSRIGLSVMDPITAVVYRLQREGGE
jgi:hypothetical protein